MRLAPARGAIAASRATSVILPVTLDSFASGSTEGSAGPNKSVAVSINVASNPNRLLLAVGGLSFATNGVGSGTVTTSSNNGGAFTAQTAAFANQGAFVYTRPSILLAPNVGAHTVTFSYSGTNWINGVKLFLLSLYNVNQTTPVDSSAIASGTTSAINLGITSDVNNMSVWGVCLSTSGLTYNKTRLIADAGASDGGYGDFINAITASGTGAVDTLTTTVGPSNAWAGSALEIKAA